MYMYMFGEALTNCIDKVPMAPVANRVATADVWYKVVSW